MFDIREGTNHDLILSGRFDASQVERARGVFLTLNEGKTVDFAQLDYISSAGLGVLLAAQKRLSQRGQSLRLINVNSHIRDVFRFSGFDQIFEIA
ncbi:MAG TPA: STAS domain-containing protein [Thermoanaerobaculia bacterium]|nr:STAS domain-containing protein [Thermoanaerobaculia bacterium]